MKVRFHKKFAKGYSRLDLKIRRVFESRLQIFCTNPYQSELSNHPLKGKWRGYRSINISGDFRAVYKEVSEQEVVFIAVGNHSQLYGWYKMIQNDLLEGRREGWSLNPLQFKRDKQMDISRLRLGRPCFFQCSEEALDDDRLRMRSPKRQRNLVFV